MIDILHANYLLNTRVKPDVPKVVEFTGNLRLNFGIRFGFIRVFKNKYFYPALDDFNLSQKLVQNVLSGHLFCEEDITGFRTDGFRVARWPKKPISDNMRIYSDMGLGNGITIYLLRDDHIEMYGFMCENFEDKQDWLIKNQNFLVRYARYFNNILGLLNVPKKFVEKDLFFIPQGFKPIDITGYAAEHECKKSILDKFLQYGVHLDIKGQAVSITPQEWKIITLLCGGCTAKQIAGSINISVETVWTYIKRFKFKTGIHYKSDISKLWDDEYYIL